MTVFWYIVPYSLRIWPKFQRCLLPPSSGQSTSTRLHGAISHKTVIFTLAAVRTEIWNWHEFSIKHPHCCPRVNKQCWMWREVWKWLRIPGTYVLMVIDGPRPSEVHFRSFWIVAHNSVQWLCGRFAYSRGVAPNKSVTAFSLTSEWGAVWPPPILFPRPVCRGQALHKWSIILSIARNTVT
jgi:hypothetical protein